MSLQESTSNNQSPLGVARRTEFIQNATIGEAECPVRIAKNTHVLIEERGEVSCVISWAIGEGTAKARVDASLVSIPGERPSS
jgi:hypothetical protein